MMFFSLIGTTLSSVLYGIIVTAVIMAILYAILSAISRNIVRSIPFYVTGVVMAALLTLQFSLTFAAYQAKSSVDAVHVYLTQLVEDNDEIVDAGESQNMYNKVVEEFPILGSFIGYVDFSGYKVSELPDVICGSISDFFNSYIWHRVWWIFGIIAIGCLVPMLYDKRNVRRDLRPKRVMRHNHSNYDDF